MADTIKVYQFLANQLRRMNWCCDEAGNVHDKANFDDACDKIAECVDSCLPSGSGIDRGCEIPLCDAIFDRKGRLQHFSIVTSFHHMNDIGYYDGWTSHTIRVRPDWDGIDFTISGRDRNQIKDYLGETFQYALTRTINYNTLAVVETV